MVDTTDYNETFRPQFHFTARKNWLNDPNGLFYYRGMYHLFFQHNPFGLEWGNMTWGHAISPDLVHWQQLPNALEPDSLGTMFSGSAVVDWENTTGFQQGEHPPIVLIYTAAGNTSPASKGKPFTQCLAYSIDGGSSWQKYPGNPVMECIRPENRDPKVIWHPSSHRWIMTLYLEGNEFAFFSSPDLKTWSPLHSLFAPESIECPDFFEIPLVGIQIYRNGCGSQGMGAITLEILMGNGFSQKPTCSSWIMGLIFTHARRTMMPRMIAEFRLPGCVEENIRGCLSISK